MSIETLDHSSITMNSSPIIDSHTNNIEEENHRIKRLKIDHNHLNNDFSIIRVHQQTNTNNNTTTVNDDCSIIGVVDQETNTNSDTTTTMIPQSSKADHLLNNKKLYLVLDLDHTLLTSILTEKLTSEEEYLKNEASLDLSKEDSSLFILEKMEMIMKLRPFVRGFLKEASQMFEMCIYTMGSRAYAKEAAKILDPENEYFDESRIFSRDNCSGSGDRKGLEVVGVPESLVLVLDDTQSVWEGHEENLILMDRYFYFASDCRRYKSKSYYSVAKKDESEVNGMLKTVLCALRKIHRRFYDESESESEDEPRDVRRVIKEVKKGVLKDCRILFGEDIPRINVVSDRILWEMAEELGATCTNEVDSGVTHVVSADGGSEKSQWAVREGKFLVCPRWVHRAFYRWRRQFEDKFPVVKNFAKSTTTVEIVFD